MRITHHIKIILIIMFLFNFNKDVNAQTYKVFKKDTLFYTKYPLSYTKEFKDTLPDGHWLYYDVQDSTVKDYEKHLMMEGYYKNSLRHGKFTYYYYPYVEKKKKREIRKVSMYKNYQNGLLDGYYCMFLGNDIKIEEGFYSKGKIHGFFIEYYNGEKERITKLKFYQNDTFQYATAFNDRGDLVFKSDAIKGQVVYYDSLGVIKNKEFYEDNKLTKYQKFNAEGVLLKEVEGVFKKSTNYLTIETPFELVDNGVVRKYQNGILKEEEYYKDGKLEKTVLIKE